MFFYIEKPPSVTTVPNGGLGIPIVPIIRFATEVCTHHSFDWQRERSQHLCPTHLGGHVLSPVVAPCLSLVSVTARHMPRTLTHRINSAAGILRRVDMARTGAKSGGLCFRAILSAGILAVPNYQLTLTTSFQKPRVEQMISITCKGSAMPTTAPKRRGKTVVSAMSGGRRAKSLEPFRRLTALCNSACDAKLNKGG